MSKNVPMQIRAAQNFVENAKLDKPKPLKDVFMSAGYTESSARVPAALMDSKIFKEELARLGFSTEAADAQVNNLLVNARKEEVKLKAADLIYKRLGAYAAEKTLNVTVKGSVEEFEKYGELRAKYETELLNTLTNEKAVRDINPRVDIGKSDENGDGDSSGLPQSSVSVPTV